MRRQALCLMYEAENLSGVKVECGSVLSTCAIRHAGWLLNRFQQASNHGGATPFELKFDRRYTGKLVPFGSSIFARTPPGRPKGLAQFQRSIFLGKSEDSDANLVGTASGVKVGRTIRRSVQPYTELKASCKSKACLGTLPKKHLVSRSSTGRCPLCEKMRPSWTKRPRL